MRFGVLGPLTLEDSSGPVPAPRGQPAVLLSWLLARANGVVPVEEAVEIIWDDRIPGQPRRAVLSLVRSIRRVIGAGLVATDAGLLLRVDDGQLDAQRFDRAIRRAVWDLDGGRSAAAEEAFRRALVMWRGDPFPDLAYHPMALPEITQLWLLRLAALEHLNSILLTRPVDYQLVADLETLTARHPERERFWRQLALALYRSGRQLEAIRVFDRCRAAGFGRLSPAMVRLERAVLRQDPQLERGELPEG